MEPLMKRLFDITDIFMMAERKDKNLPFLVDKDRKYSLTKPARFLADIFHELLRYTFTSVFKNNNCQLIMFMLITNGYYFSTLK